MAITTPTEPITGEFSGIRHSPLTGAVIADGRSEKQPPIAAPQAIAAAKERLRTTDDLIEAVLIDARAA